MSDFSDTGTTACADTPVERDKPRRVHSFRERAQFDWTEERVGRLKALFADGLSCSQIAAEIAGREISRNAVIGKLHRLGLRRGIQRQRPDVAHRPPRRPRRANPPGPVMFPVPPATAPAPAVLRPDCKPIGLLDLTASTCRWPVTDEPPHMFCGAQPVDGLPYCPWHSRMAYRRPGEVAA